MRKAILFVLVVNASLLGVRIAQETLHVEAGGARADEDGDTNGDGNRDASDVIYYLNWLIQGGPEPVALSQGGGTVTSAQRAFLDELVDHVSVEDVVNGDNGEMAKTIRLSGVHLQIVNGEESELNGLGILIVGHNRLRSNPDEDGIPDPNLRTGSHNLVVGHGNNYTNFGGIVAGLNNSRTDSYASAFGGWRNSARARLATVLGGGFNEAQSGGTTVAGGFGNQAGNEVDPGLGAYASVNGGRSNRATGSYSTVSAGRNNEAQGSYSSVTGGGGLLAPGEIVNEEAGFGVAIDGSFVGAGNTVSGHYSVVTGGSVNIAGDANAPWDGAWSSVAGGVYSSALGYRSAVSGGEHNSAMAGSSVISGGLSNATHAVGSVVVGGRRNRTADSATYSGVGGGGDVEVTERGYTAVGVLQIHGGDSEVFWS